MTKASHIPVPKTANELWFDALVRHQVHLMRVSGGVRNNINGLLNTTERAMVDRIHAVLAGKTKLSPARLRKAESLIKQLKQIRTEVWIEVDGLWRETMKDLTVTEVQQINQMLHTVSPAELSTQLPTANKLKSLVKTLPFEGHTLGSWAKKVADDDISRIAAQVKIGIVQGETTQSIARRIIGTAKMKGMDGVTQITRRNAEAITRTAVNSFSNAARGMYFAENSDLFDVEVFVATLDGRTTPVCRSLDGDRFPVGQGATPPMHFSCRSLRVAEINGQVVGMRPAKPVTEKMMVDKYAKANGLGPIKNRAKLPRGHKGKYDVFQRAEMRRMTGRVPAKVTYNEWLKNQSIEFQDDVLGPTRGKLFRKGGLTLDNFVDKKGATIRLDQLANTDVAAFKAAGLPVSTSVVPAPPAVSLLDQRLAQPDVQSLLGNYQHAYGVSNHQLMKKARGKLALKGVFIDKTGRFSTNAMDAGPTFPRLQPTEPLTKTPVIPTALNKQVAWESGLSGAEKASIEYWSSDVYAVGDVRSYQAGKLSGLSAKTKKSSALFTKTMKNAPNYRGTVYRGQGFDAGVKSIKVGENFKFNQAVSGTKSFDVGEEFASYAPTDDIVLFEIKSTTGKDISKLVTEEYLGQQEIFLGKGSSYRIISKKFVKSNLMDNPASGYWRVVLDES